MTDDNTRKLIKLYRKTRSAKALHVLVVNYQSAIYKICYEIKDSTFSMNEKVSIGNNFLIHAIENEFNLKQNKMKFLSFLYNRIPFRIIDEKRKVLCKRKLRYNESASYINPQVNIDDQEIFDNTVADNSVLFVEKMENKELLDMVVFEIAKLPELQRVVMGCIYYGMSQKEISKQLNLTGGRIAQIKKMASNTLYNNLRAKLNGEMDGIKTALIQDL